MRRTIRQEAADKRQQTRGSRQEEADKRQQTRGSRQEEADKRKKNSVVVLFPASSQDSG
jgi:hypothetical protein